MAVKIRLMRFGKKKQPLYRIVVIDSRRSRNSEYLERIGHYNPSLVKNKLVLDKQRLQFWQERGAQPSKGLLRLLK